MKNTKKILAFSVATLAVASSTTLGVYATGTGTSQHDVTVGEVDEALYSVDISWGDMAFDYKYDSSTNSHNFKAHIGCRSTTYFSSTSPSGLQYYSDQNCQTPQAGELVDQTTYYAKTNIGGVIYVEDNTTNGMIEAQASFTADDDYDWVTGKIYGGASLTGTNATEIEYTHYQDGALFSGHGALGPASWGYLYLEASDDENHTVNASDKIGTVTVNITPYTDPLDD